MASAIYQEMNVPDADTGNIWACANAGLAVGALFWGLIVDVIGRRWAFNLTCLITSVFGLLLAAPMYNYGAICGIYFLASLGLGGNIPIDAIIAHEFLPQSRRNLVTLLSLWQPIGVVVASAISFGTAAKYRCTPDSPSCRAPGLAPGEYCCGVSNNMGWRYDAIVLGGMTLVIFFLRYFVFTFHESPKFLLSRHRDAEAIEVLHKIAKFNKAAPPTLTVEMLEEIDIKAGTPPLAAAELNKNVVKNFFSNFKSLKGLFTNRLQLICFILLAFAYMGDYWSFNLAGSFLPLILLRRNISSGATTVTETYRQYIYIYLPGIIGAILGLFSVSLPLVGRKWSLVFSALCQGIAMAMYTQVYNTAGVSLLPFPLSSPPFLHIKHKPLTNYTQYVGLNALEYVMQTFFNAVLYSSAPELFDTIYRGSATGMLSCVGRLAGIVAPFAGAHYLATSSGGILWLGAGGIWLSALMMVFLPVEMRNRQMF